MREISFLWQRGDKCSDRYAGNDECSVIIEAGMDASFFVCRMSEGEVAEDELLGMMKALKV